MTFNPFNWLRSAARNAVLSGVGDAVLELHQAGAGEPMSMQQIGDIVQKALPAAAEQLAGEESATRKAKAK